jgi:RimJ/RimL family protein N-acetyltransferase
LSKAVTFSIRKIPHEAIEFTRTVAGYNDPDRLRLDGSAHVKHPHDLAASRFWLTTERLGLRRFTVDDLDWLAALFSDPDVARNLGGTKNRTQTQEMLNARILRYYEEHPGLGIWMAVERSSGEPVGFHLLNHIQGESIIQVGYALVKSAWGRGLATEMAGALLRYGFVDLSIPKISGMTTLGNVASQRVLEKVGLRRCGERSFPHPAYAAEGPMAWFERDAASWLAERAHV